MVIDASNLERNLYYATQVIELGYPTAIALNMIDVAAQNGLQIDTAAAFYRARCPRLPHGGELGRGRGRAETDSF